MLGVVASLLGIASAGAAGFAWRALKRQAMPAECGETAHPPAAWQTPGQSIRIGTYNIHSGQGTDGRRDLRRIAQHLRDADIVGLQEVARSLFPGSRSDVESLAQELDTGWLFLPGHSRLNRPCFGNGLLTRFPVLDWYREPLTDTEGTKFRTLTVAGVKIGESRCPVLVTHVSKCADQNGQLSRIFERFLLHDTAILVGDFNATPSHPMLRSLIDSGDALDAIGTALGNDDREDRIDWILVRGFSIGGGGVQEKGASDHPYYWVDLQLQPTTRSSEPGRDINRTSLTSANVVQ